MWLRLLEHIVGTYRGCLSLCQSSAKRKGWEVFWHPSVISRASELRLIPACFSTFCAAFHRAVSEPSCEEPGRNRVSNRSCDPYDHLIAPGRQYGFLCCSDSNVFCSSANADGQRLPPSQLIRPNRLVLHPSLFVSASPLEAFNKSLVLASGCASSRYAEAVHVNYVNDAVVTASSVSPRDPRDSARYALK